MIVRHFRRRKSRLLEGIRRILVAMQDTQYEQQGDYPYYAN